MLLEDVALKTLILMIEFSILGLLGDTVIPEDGYFVLFLSLSETDYIPRLFLLFLSSTEKCC